MPNMIEVTERRKVNFTEREPRDIWGEVVSQDMPQMVQLVKFMKDVMYGSYSGGISLTRLFEEAVTDLLSLIYVNFRKESDYFSEEIVENGKRIMRGPEMAAAQRMYTLAHLRASGACSTAVVWDPRSGEMTCFRSLDWVGAPVIGAVTRIFDFHDGDKIECSVAGVAGMVGALTGMKEGFAVVVNYAPWSSIAVSHHRDPTFLVRELLQDSSVNTYEKAYERISEWETGAPVFITLCGTGPGQMCVFEFGMGRVYTRGAAGDVLVQTNHFDPKGPHKRQNPRQTCDEPVPGNPGSWSCVNSTNHSCKRQKMLETSLSQWLEDESTAGEDIVSFLQGEFRKPPVWNCATAQWVLMRPKTGEMQVWARQ